MQALTVEVEQTVTDKALIAQHRKVSHTTAVDGVISSEGERKAVREAMSEPPTPFSEDPQIARGRPG